MLIFNASKTCKSPLVAGFEETKVSALINPDIDLLNCLFAPLEVELISSIPLCEFYSVKSGYNLLAKENSINNRVQGNQMQHQDVWKDIWGLSI